ncbi:MAG: GxxExxY protein [Candidatus Omnitrophica bacterium]|nr:GxxExxY protein [Candidatus Omnitrophota bacterium]
MIKKQITEIKDRDPLTERIIACSYKVHSELGPGFNENIYHNALEVALKQQGLRYQTQGSFGVSYQGNDVGRFKLDLIVEDKIVVEVKALTGSVPTIFESQVLSYLKASGYKTGLLVNFGNRSCQVRRLMV